MGSKDLEVNPLKLEAGVVDLFQEGISTRSIQANLINTSLKYTTIDEPDWRYVAGRLLMMNLLEGG